MCLVSHREEQYVSNNALVPGVEPVNPGTTGLFMTDLLPNVYSNMKSASDRQTCLITRFIKLTILRLGCFRETVCVLDANKVNSLLMGETSFDGNFFMELFYVSHTLTKMIWLTDSSIIVK